MYIRYHNSFTKHSLTTTYQHNTIEMKKKQQQNMKKQHFLPWSTINNNIISLYFWNLKENILFSVMVLFKISNMFFGIKMWIWIYVFLFCFFLCSRVLSLSWIIKINDSDWIHNFFFDFIFIMYCIDWYVKSMNRRGLNKWLWVGINDTIRVNENRGGVYKKNNNNKEINSKYSTDRE